MKTRKIVASALATLLTIFPFISLTSVVYAAQTKVGLGTADSFAVLAGTGITNTGTTTITGDVGTYPTTTETGFGSVTITGTNHAGDGVTQGAKTDLTTAYNDAAGRGPTTPIVADLGGQTLTPGVYNSGSSISLTGTVTLDAQGDANAVFIFQAGSTLTTAAASTVSLTNGAQACNVFWQVGSSATLGTTTTFVGSILALTSITLNTGATVNGRVLARNGAVTLDTNTISKSTCLAGTSGGGSVAANNAGPKSPPVYNCPPLPAGVTSPDIIETRRVSPTSIFVSWGPYTGTDRFNVRYGPSDGNWLYNTDVTGFSTTLNSLPANQPIWIQVAARNDCLVGNYGAAKMSGAPKLPNTGFNIERNFPLWFLSTGILIGISGLLFYRKNQ